MVLVREIVPYSKERQLCDVSHSEACNTSVQKKKPKCFINLSLTSPEEGNPYEPENPQNKRTKKPQFEFFYVHRVCTGYLCLPILKFPSRFKYSSRITG